MTLSTEMVTPGGEAKNRINWTIYLYLEQAPWLTREGMKSILVSSYLHETVTSYNKCCRLKQLFVSQSKMSKWTWKLPIESGFLKWRSSLRKDLTSRNFLKIRENRYQCQWTIVCWKRIFFLLNNFFSFFFLAFCLFKILIYCIILIF